MNHHGSRNQRYGVTSRRRLRGYDYTTPGLYFITICTHQRVHLFGEVLDDTMCLSPAGQMVSAIWAEVPSVFPDVVVDSNVTMPNHVHALIGIGLEHPDQPHPSLSQVLHWYKSSTTTLYMRGVRAEGWSRFDDHLWQEGFHDHIIRNEKSLDRIREYIQANPSRWPQDVFSRSDTSDERERIR